MHARRAVRYAPSMSYRRLAVLGAILFVAPACPSHPRQSSPTAAAPAPPPAPPTASAPRPTVITRPSQRDTHVGRLVTLRGVVANTKIPTLVGVDVASDAPDLRGKPAEATGILRRRVVTRAQLEERLKKAGMFAHRGPGTFYRLVRPGSGRIVQVRAPGTAPRRP